MSVATGMKTINGWSVVYERARREDGSLYFPERLTDEFLDKARRTMGSYLFANQYQNEIIPEDEKRFKSHWLRYYSQVPDNVYHFAFIDPAIGQKNHHDYTGIVVVAVDPHGDWFMKVAKRERLTPTQIVDKVFEIHRSYPRCMGIGIESVGYQEALLYLIAERCRFMGLPDPASGGQKHEKIPPVKDIKRNSVSKETRILALVPRFEWNRISIAQGMVDFEDEYSTFPRGTHDDILDSLASLEELVFYPVNKPQTIEKPNSPADKNYESWYIQNKLGKNRSSNDD